MKSAVFISLPLLMVAQPSKYIAMTRSVPQLPTPVSMATRNQIILFCSVVAVLIITQLHFLEILVVVVIIRAEAVLVMLIQNKLVEDNSVDELYDD